MNNLTNWYSSGRNVHFGVHGGGVSVHPDTPNAEKIAALLAAAPVLLEALEALDECGMLEVFHGQGACDRSAIEKTKAAIAKARGEA